MKWYVLVASFLLAGCMSHYTVLVEGRVTGATPTTPRVVRGGVYDCRTADLEEVAKASKGDLVPLGDARVDLGFIFDGAEKPRFTKKVEVDRSTGLFRARIDGKAHSELTGVTVTTNAPGHESAAATLGPDPDGSVRKKVLVVLEPVNVPPR